MQYEYSEDEEYRTLQQITISSIIRFFYKTKYGEKNEQIELLKHSIDHYLTILDFLEKTPGINSFVKFEITDQIKNFNRYFQIYCVEQSDVNYQIIQSYAEDFWNLHIPTPFD